MRKQSWQNLLLTWLGILLVSIFFSVSPRVLSALTLAYSEKLALTNNVNSHMNYLKRNRGELLRLLTQGPDENLIKRYLMWLNVWVMDSHNDLNPPKDIKNIWYLHMLNSRNYILVLESLSIGHNANVADLLTKGFQFVEPIEEINKPCFFLWTPSRHTLLEQIWQECYGFSLDKKNRVHEIFSEVAVELELQNSKYFLEKVDPDNHLFTNDKAIERYERFLSLFEFDHENTFYPTLDIELVWLTHRLNSASYLKITRALKESKFVENYYQAEPHDKKKNIQSTAKVWNENFDENIESGSYWQTFDGIRGRSRYTTRASSYSRRQNSFGKYQKYAPQSKPKSRRV